MKKKFAIILICCLALFTSAFGCSSNISGGEGGRLEEYADESKINQYRTDSPAISTSDAYDGFIILSEAEDNIQIKDDITGETVSFSDIVSRQIDIFATDILARLNYVWGAGSGFNTVLGENYTLTKDGVSHSAVIEKSSAVKKAPTTAPTNWNIEDIDTYAFNLASGSWSSGTNYMTNNLNLTNAVVGGNYWQNSDFATGPIINVELLKKQGLGTIESWQIVSFSKDDSSIASGINVNIIDGLTVGDIVYIQNPNGLSFSADRQISEISLTQDHINSGIVKMYYSMDAFKWQKNISNAGLKDQIKLAIANILAYGQYNYSSDLSVCLSDIDHLGFLQIADEENAVEDEVERIISYILTDIIGQSALTKDEEALRVLKTCLTNDSFISTTVIPNEKAIAHYYRAYELLVPELVKTVINNCFATTTPDEDNEGKVLVTGYNNSYKVYPVSPKIFSQTGNFPNMGTGSGGASDNTNWEDAGSGDLTQEYDVDEDIDTEGFDQDIFWINQFKSVKNILFMPKRDIPVTEFMFYFEAKNESGEFKISLDLQISVSLTINGEEVLENVLAIGNSVSNGVVSIKAGQYDAESNDNSCTVCVADIVAAKVKTMLADGLVTSLPTNGVVTVGKYNGEIPDGELSLFNNDYITHAGGGGIGSSSTINSRNNEIQVNFSVVNAYTEQGDTKIPYLGKVLLNIGISDPL